MTNGFLPNTTSRKSDYFKAAIIAALCSASSAAPWTASSVDAADFCAGGVCSSDASVRLVSGRCATASWSPLAPPPRSNALLVLSFHGFKQPIPCVLQHVAAATRYGNSPLVSNEHIL